MSCACARTILATEFETMLFLSTPLEYTVSVFLNRLWTVKLTGSAATGRAVTGWYGYLATTLTFALPIGSTPSRSQPLLRFLLAADEVVEVHAEARHEVHVGLAGLVRVDRDGVDAVRERPVAIAPGPAGSARTGTWSRRRRSGSLVHAKLQLRYSPVDEEPAEPVGVARAVDAARGHRAVGRAERVDRTRGRRDVLRVERRVEVVRQFLACPGRHSHRGCRHRSWSSGTGTRRRRCRSVAPRCCP